MTKLQVKDDKKQITEKKSVISACNVDYRLKRSGPKVRNMLFKKYPCSGGPNLGQIICQVLVLGCR